VINWPGGWGRAQRAPSDPIQTKNLHPKLGHSLGKIALAESKLPVGHSAAARARKIAPVTHPAMAPRSRRLPALFDNSNSPRTHMRRLAPVPRRGACKLTQRAGGKLEESPRAKKPVFIERSARQLSLRKSALPSSQKNLCQSPEKTHLHFPNSAFRLLPRSSFIIHRSSFAPPPTSDRSPFGFWKSVISGRHPGL
jgi:hypothetical protein